MPRAKTTIAIVDDHQIIIEGLLALLEGHPDFEVIHQTTQPTRLLQLLQQRPADILLTDVMMPEMNGLELAIQVKKNFPSIKILALSMSGQGDIINQMINKADISGYLLKDISKQTLILALQKVAEGKVYFTEEVMNEMLKDSQLKKEVQNVHLTTREIEIISYIEKEKSNKEIADMLFISEHTVETHRKNIFRKTGINSVIGLIKFAYEHGLV